MSAVAGPAWLRAWFTAFAPHTLPLVLGDAAQLWLRRGRIYVLGLPLRTLHSPTNEHTPRYDWPANLPAHALGEWLTESRRGYRWDLMQLEFLTPDSQAARVVSELPKPWQQVDLRARWETPVIDLTQGADSYFSGLPQKLRANTNRAEHGLEKIGTLDIRDLATGTDWRTWLDTALTVESSGWKADTGGAILQSDPVRAFYQTILEQFRANGALRLFGLTLDDELLAFNLLVRDGPTWFGLKTGYTQAWSRYSPGNVLFRHVLRTLFEDSKAHSLDMLNPVTDWKRRWASHIEPRVRLRLYAPSWRGRLAYHGERSARWLYRWPAVKKLATFARRHP
jgi:hypothetical protein